MSLYLLSDAPKCSYKGPQRIYGAIGEKILLVCDVTPFPQGLYGEIFLLRQWLDTHGRIFAVLLIITAQV